MIVCLRLERFDGTTHQLSVIRRTDWLPSDTFRETLANTEDYQAWRDYVLEPEASAERGILVYRQVLCEHDGHWQVGLE